MTMTENDENIGGSKPITAGGSKRGSKSYVGRVQKEILELLTGDNPLTIRQIAERRMTTIRAVNKIRNILQQKGLLAGDSYRGFQTEHTAPAPPTRNLHGQRFKIGIISFVTAYAEQQYREKIGNKGVLFIGNTIKLRREVIEVYSQARFNGQTQADCDRDACLYWRRYFDALESKYGVVVVKQGYSNILETYCHISLLENGIAHRQNVLRDRIYYFDENTGKLWLETDRSFNGNDLEFVGTPADTRRDSALFEKHLRDWRNPNQATPSQLQKMQADMIHMHMLEAQQRQQQFQEQEHLEDIKKKHPKDLPSYFG